MRTITVSPETYTVLYQGMLGTDGYAGAEARLADRILGKFEEAGEYDPDTKLFGMKQGTATIKLEDAEFDFMVKRLENTVWLPRFVRTAVRVMNWFKDHAPDVKPV